MGKKREDNLIPNNQRSPNEVRDNGRKGGIASGEARRRKKTLREFANIVNSLPLSNTSRATLPSGIKDEQATYQMGFVFMVYQKAIKGDTRAMKLWIDLSNTLEEERNKLEIKKLKAEIDKLNNEVSGNVEDLTPLADMLKE
ncbi:MAG: hypothetical protein IKW45_06615 [Clostridia bacterium]|nr:hypothetical protein [Clostridia bacterium]